MQLDLFGTATASTDPETALLVQDDNETRASRAARLRYVTESLPNYGFLVSVEMHYLLSEGRSTYVNGDFAATIFVAQAFIEHWFMPHALRTAGPTAQRWGLARMVEHFRKTRQLHPFLLDRVDRLRRARNPFAHTFPFGHPARLDQRSFAETRHHEDIIHKEARDALGLMYAVVTHIR